MDATFKQDATKSVKNDSVRTNDSSGVKIHSYSKNKTKEKDKKYQQNLNVSKGYLIPLSEVYLPKTVKTVQNNDIGVASVLTVSDFIVEGDSIIFVNNDKQIIDCFKIKQRKLNKITDYPEKLKGDYQNEPKSIYKIYRINQNQLFFHTYNYYSGNYNFENNLWKIEPNTYYVKILKYSRVTGVKRETEKQRDLIINKFNFLNKSFIYDSSKTFFSLGISIENDSLMLYSSKTDRFNKISLKSISLPLNEIQGINIVYSNNSTLYFLLKTFGNNLNDVLVCYKYQSGKVISAVTLKSSYDYETYSGDPGSTITGKRYKIFDNYLWRMRTTLKGVLFEKWNLKDVIN